MRKWMSLVTLLEDTRYDDIVTHEKESQIRIENEAVADDFAEALDDHRDVHGEAAARLFCDVLNAELLFFENLETHLGDLGNHSERVSKVLSNFVANKSDVHGWIVDQDADINEIVRRYPDLAALKTSATPMGYISGNLGIPAFSSWKQMDKQKVVDEMLRRDNGEVNARILRIFKKVFPMHMAWFDKQLGR